MKTVIKLLTILLLIPLFLHAQEVDSNILAAKHYKMRTSLFKENPIGKEQIVFFGNSITEAGKWDILFPNRKTINRGISGDNTDGMLSRIHEVIDAQPTKLFIMAGINDISLHRTNDVVIRQVKLLVRQVQAGSPNTEIYIQSTLPINDQKLKYERLRGKEVQIEHYNTLLKSLCKEMNLTYVDIYNHILEAPLTLDAKYTNDGLHINNDAYHVWADLIKEHIEQTIITN